MTAFNYIRTQRQAGKLIQDFGIKSTWRKITDVLNDDGYEVITNKVTDFECHVVLLQRNLMGRKKISTSETEQRAGEIKALLAVSNKVTPGGKDILIVGSDEYRIMSVDPLKPAGVTLLYKLELQV